MGAEVVYATTADRHLYVGGGSPFRWQRRDQLVPGLLVDSPASAAGSIFAARQALYRSVDDGRTWQRLSCPLLINRVAISKADPNLIYIAADGEDAAGTATSVTGGLYKTKDGGRTWERLTRFPSVPSDDPRIQTVSISPVDPEIVAIAPAVLPDVLVSPDGGLTWRRMHLESAMTERPAQVIDVIFGSGSRPALWASVILPKRVLRTPAADLMTWRPTTKVGSGVAQEVNRVVPDPMHPDVAYADDRQRAAWYTADGGRHWQRLTGSAASLTVSSSKGTLYTWAGHRIRRSRDHGTSWTLLPDLPR